MNVDSCKRWMPCVTQVSFLELYNEELTDLLSSDDDSKKLRWRVWLGFLDCVVEPAA